MIVTNEVAQWFGAMVASCLAALWARRADIRSKDMQSQINGPKKEDPSLRDMIINSETRLVNNQNEIAERVFSLHGLFMSSSTQIIEIEGRLVTLEDEVKGISDINGSREKLLALSLEIERIRYNLHQIANKLQMKMMSAEDYKRSLSENKTDKE